MDASEEFDAALPAPAQHLICAARAFAEQVVARHAEEWERERVWPVETLRHACVEPRLAAVEVPTARGGLGLPFRARVRVAEELAKVDFGFAFALINHHNAAARVAEAGTAAAADRYLPRLLSGELIGCTAMSESEAGSDFAAITTTAKAVSGGWLLSGAKRWIGNAVALTCSSPSLRPMSARVATASLVFWSTPPRQVSNGIRRNRYRVCTPPASADSPCMITSRPKSICCIRLEKAFASPWPA